MAQAITLAEALVLVKLDDTVFKKQISTMSKSMDSVFKASGKIAATGFAIGLKGVNNYLKTTDAGAVRLRGSLITLEYAFFQMSARIGKVISEKYKLTNVIDKLSEAMMNLKSKDIKEILKMFEFSGAVYGVGKLTTSLAPLATALFSVMTYMKQIDTVKSVGGLKKSFAAMPNVNTIYQSASKGPINVGSYVDETMASKKTMVGSAKNGKFAGEGMVASLAKVARVGAIVTVAFTAISRILERLGVKMPKLSDIFSKFNNVLSILGGIIMFIIEPLIKFTNVLVDLIFIIVEASKGIWNWFKSKKDPFGQLQKSLDVMYETLYDTSGFEKAWKIMKTNWDELVNGKKPEAEEEDKPFQKYGSAGGAVSFEGLNRAMQDFYNQNQLLEVNQKQLNCLEEIKNILRGDFLQDSPVRGDYVNNLMKNTKMDYVEPIKNVTLTNGDKLRNTGSSTISSGVYTTGAYMNYTGSALSNMSTVSGPSK